jgi:acetoacetyl-CoA synthetase
MREAMVSHGVQTEDVVAAVISNSVDAMVICLAALSIGAIWSSASCELGTEAIVERFSQVNPKLVFADDAYRYAGKLISLADKMENWSQKLGTKCRALKAVIVVPYCMVDIQLENIWHGKSMVDFLGATQGRELSFEYLPVSQPAFILYSSGTVCFNSLLNLPVLC